MSNRNNSGQQGFASMDKDEVREIAAKGGRASRNSDDGADAGNSGDASAAYQPSSASAQPTDVDDAPANHTRSKEELPSETPLSQTVDRDDPNVETYRGRQGFASMDKERVAEIGSMGGNMPMDKTDRD
ncbi:hypothetical protein HDU86_001364 [Geranomyces michiganensis]|nr:hypothetical protein HDU86_001364 [Geranomyces michiganensis]